MIHAAHATVRTLPRRCPSYGARRRSRRWTEADDGESFRNLMRSRGMCREGATYSRLEPQTPSRNRSPTRWPDSAQVIPGEWLAPGRRNLLFRDCRIFWTASFPSGRLQTYPTVGRGILVNSATSHEELPPINAEGRHEKNRRPSSFRTIREAAPPARRRSNAKRRPPARSRFPPVRRRSGL